MTIHVLKFVYNKMYECKQILKECFLPRILTANTIPFDLLQYKKWEDTIILGKQIELYRHINKKKLPKKYKIVYSSNLNLPCFENVKYDPYDGLSINDIAAMANITCQLGCLLFEKSFLRIFLKIISYDLRDKVPEIVFVKRYIMNKYNRCDKKFLKHKYT